jgi:hypothetical protein
MWKRGFNSHIHIRGLKMSFDEPNENFADQDEAATERMESKYGVRLLELDVLKLAGIKNK